MRFIPLSLLLVLLPACATSSSAQPLTASVAQFHVEPLPTMVARKVDLPLYVVVGPELSDRLHINGFTLAIFTIHDVDLTNVRMFATRDVPRALAPYFASVHVVYDEKSLPTTPHLRAQVKLSKVEFQTRQVPQLNGMSLTAVYGALEWAFALQVAGRPDFIFTFNERTVSATAMQGFEDTSEFESMLQEAVRHLLAEYDKQGVQQKLLQLPVADVETN